MSITNCRTRIPLALPALTYRFALGVATEGQSAKGCALLIDDRANGRKPLAQRSLAAGNIDLGRVQAVQSSPKAPKGAAVLGCFGPRRRPTLDTATTDSGGLGVPALGASERRGPRVILARALGPGRSLVGASRR